MTVAGPQLVRDVLLIDGTTLRLRAPTSDDLDDVIGFYNSLSPESRYMRFHGYGQVDSVARALVRASGVDRAALIARHGGRVVAIAQYEQLREPGAAEAAFAVADDFQRRGTATRMLEQLAMIAAERGIHRFDAEVLSDNRSMLSVFEHAGFKVRRMGGFGEVTVSLEITPTDAVREQIDRRDHYAAVASLRPLLRPASVTLLGASSEVGATVMSAIRDGGFEGTVAERLPGPEEAPDLAILAVAEDELVSAATEAVRAGARALLVLTSSEGEDSERLGQVLLELARAGGLRLVGPSSLGVINTDPAVRLRATFAGALVTPGRLAVCSQSGAVGIGLLGHAAARRLGIAAYLSLGARVDVSTNDLLELWEDDDRVAAVMLYVETFGNPQHFARIAQRVSRRKPILAVKGRRAAEAVRRDAGSHTAAALRGDAVADALFQQAGVLRFRSGDELFNAAEFFESQTLPAGRRVAVLSNSAGVATLAVDACATRGLVVAGPGSPVVLGAGSGPGEYAQALGRMLADPGVDAVMVYYVDRLGGRGGAVLAAVSEVAGRAETPVVASIVGADGQLPVIEGQSVPNYRFPESCAGVLGRAAERREWLSRPLGERFPFECVDPSADALITSCLEREGVESCWLGPREGEALLAAYGIAFEPAAECGSVQEAGAAARSIDGPVALKARLPPPRTPSDLDAVLLGLEGEAAIEAGWRELRRRVELAGQGWSGAVVQRLAPPGADVLVGAVSDPDLGPVMAVGLGGRQAGLATTTAFRLLPATDVEADELIDGSESVVAQLGGFRGRPRLDRDGLRELILRFAALLRDHPEAVEVDLNPVRLMARGYVVLEMRLRGERQRPPERVKTW